jgi:hypothetical protein
MGTLSLTYVYDNKEPLVCMYRQFDGYPSGHGKELAEFLSAIEIVNGLRSGSQSKVANGAGCLAAQMVGHFKTDAGGIYLQSVTNRDYDWIDYIYHVYVDSETLSVTVEIQNELKPTTVAKFKKYCEEN